MQSARALESRLRRAQLLRQGREQRRAHVQTRLNRLEPPPDRANGFLAAQTATGRDEAAPGQTRRIELHARGKKHIEAVAGAVARIFPDAQNVVVRTDQPFGEQESRRELVVVPRRAHGHNDGTRVDTDFQRLLHRQFVAATAGGPLGPAHDLLA